MKIFYFLFFIFISFKSLAHECVLKGTSANDITIYNACKADARQNKPKNDDLNNSLLKVKIKKLKEENKKLKNQLFDLKIRLNSLLERVNSYIN